MCTCAFLSRGTSKRLLEFQSQGGLRLGNQYTPGDNTAHSSYSSPQGPDCTQGGWQVQEPEVRKAGLEKGLIQESRDMWRNSHFGEHSHQAGPFRADGVPQTVILGAQPRTGEGWLESGRRELQTFPEHLTFAHTPHRSEAGRTRYGTRALCQEPLSCCKVYPYSAQLEKLLTIFQSLPSFKK